MFARMDCDAPTRMKILAGPPCEKCGGPTRVVSIAPHRRLKRRHVWTVRCENCAAVGAVEMPKPRNAH